MMKLQMSNPEHRNLKVSNNLNVEFREKSRPPLYGPDGDMLYGLGC